jgi:SAM-dependent MidA family methyltransferase
VQTHPQSQALTTIISDRLAASPQKRLTFAEYMDLVLYHPQHGYYSSGTAKIGSKGDFFTSASLGCDFGELAAEQFFEMWEVMGKPEAFTILEMGAGTGALAADILQYLAEYHSDFFAVLNYTIIEQSPAFIKRQKAELNGKLGRLSCLAWQSWEEIPDGAIIGCLFSNELIDALPVHLVTLEGSKLQEIYVTFSEEKIVEVIGEISNSKIAEYFELIGINFPSSAHPDGYRTEVNLAALNWLETVTKKLKRGYLLTIDYGYPAAKYYHPQRHQGTLQCYYQHRHHNNPYTNLGMQDITAHVNFTALERYGEKLGLDVLGFRQQGIFLMALGLGDRLSELSSGKYNFQQILQRRDALHQLIDPGGLGGFGVLVQTKNLSQQEKARSLRGLLVDFRFGNG